MLFRNVLFSLQIFGDFSSLSFCWFLVLILMWPENILWCYWNIFLRCVLRPEIWSILMNAPCELEMNVSSDVVGWIIHKSRSGPIHCSVQLYPCWFSAAGSVMHSSDWQRGTDVTNYSSRFIYFALQFCHVFWCFVIGCVYINYCYAFLENWCLYQLQFSLFLMIFFALKSQINIATSVFFWFMLGC
jgi:hypothetical protein